MYASAYGMILLVYIAAIDMKGLYWSFYCVFHNTGIILGQRDGALLTEQILVGAKLQRLRYDKGDHCIVTLPRMHIKSVIFYFSSFII